MESAQSRVVIRPANATDAPMILGLIQELAEYEKLSEMVVATPEQITATLFGEGAVAECLLAETVSETPAEAGGASEMPAGTAPAVVGMALFFSNYSTFLGRAGIYLEDLYVQPAWRGQGIGKQLLRAVAQRAVQRQCGRLEWSVLNWNQPAIDFYQSLGAEPLQEWTVYRLTGPGLERLGRAD